MVFVCLLLLPFCVGVSCLHDATMVFVCLFVCCYSYCELVFHI